MTISKEKICENIEFLYVNLFMTNGSKMAFEEPRLEAVFQLKLELLMYKMRNRKMKSFFHFPSASYAGFL